MKSEYLHKLFKFQVRTAEIKIWVIFLFIQIFTGCSYGPPNVSSILFRDKKVKIGALMEVKGERAQSYQLDSIRTGYGSDGKMEYYNYEQSLTAYLRYNYIIIVPYLSDFVFKAGIGAGSIIKNVYGIVFVNSFAIGKNGGFDEFHLSYQIGVKVKKNISLVYDYYNIYYSDFEKGGWGPETIYKELSDMHKAAIQWYPKSGFSISPYILYSPNYKNLGGGLSLNL